MKTSEFSNSIEEAVRWRLFELTVDEARKAFADVPADELQTAIDRAVAEVRAGRHRARAQRP